MLLFNLQIVKTIIRQRRPGVLQDKKQKKKIEKEK